MDLVYVPEVLTYGFFRAPQYRDYEQPWNKDYFNHGKSIQMHSQRLPQYIEQRSLSRDNCYLCKENKRRSLAAYIKGKSRRGPCQGIHEEEEKEEERERVVANSEGSTSRDNKKSTKNLEFNSTCSENDKNAQPIT